MAVSKSYLDFVLEQLAAVPAVRTRRMFGAVGLYAGEMFFALIDDDVLYCKVDDDLRGDYEARGMPPFRPYADRPELSMSYYQAPPDVLDDAEELARWARRSIEVATRAAARKPIRTPLKRKSAARRSSKR